MPFGKITGSHARVPVNKELRGKQLMKFLSKFRIFKRSKSSTENNNKSQGIKLGHAISFRNTDLEIDLYGAPREIVDEFSSLGLNINEVARHIHTEIVTYGILQSEPNIDWQGGPQGQNMIRFLEMLSARDLKSAEIALHDDPNILAKDHLDASIPLITYAAKGDLEIVNFLLTHSASPSLPGHFDLTPLHWAAAAGYDDVAASLLDSGADPIALGWFLLTPAEVAALNGHSTLAETLKQSSPGFYDTNTWMNIFKRMGISTSDQQTSDDHRCVDAPLNRAGSKLIDQDKSVMIDNWWKAFVGHSTNLRNTFCNRTDFDVAGFMFKNLQAIDASMMWEFGPALNVKGHRLVITPEDRKDLRPLVTEILNRAPALEGWEFYPYRPPVDFDHAKTTVESRTGTPLVGLNFTGEINEINQVDLAFIILDAKDKESGELAHRQAFVMVESILGEEILDKWIGAIEISDSLSRGNNHKPISELGIWVNDQIRKIKQALPSKPFYERANDEQWTLFKITPPKEKEYVRQEDMIVAKTMCIPLWKNAHSRASFTSERFSKIGEIFCYVKLDGREGLDGTLFEDKSEIEDALDNALISEKLGCNIGGGTGLQYSYIDLALTDLDKGIAVVQNVLRNGRITRKSWILFFDSELESEWIGVWDDSPPPIMPVFEE
jgi:hypothetical protein